MQTKSQTLSLPSVRRKNIWRSFSTLVALTLLFVSNFMLASAQPTSENFERKPWEMHRGGDFVDLNPPVPSHGHPDLYGYAMIPDQDDAGWHEALGGESIFFEEKSELPARSCLRKADFTYFQTDVEVPEGASITDFFVSFEKVDDGARAYIFNTENPNGAFNPEGDVVLGGDPKTADLSEFIVAGETNRVVIVQVDDCPSGNNIENVQLNINGDVADVTPDPATGTILCESYLPDEGVALTGVRNSSVQWGDYDGDGDLDAVLAGATGGASRGAKIYRNENGIFIDIGATLAAVQYASVAWGYYDGDDDLDLVLTGNDAGTNVAQLYRNDEGVFTDIEASLTGVWRGSVDWADYDDDGDQDILLTGESDSGPITQIYRNDSGKFKDVEAGLVGVQESSADWGDYDGDGDLDILLTGKSSSGLAAQIYRNVNGVFTDIEAGLTGVMNSSAAWGDYDGDGDQDILLTGKAASGAVAQIYKNEDGTFTDVEAELTGVFWSSVNWKDYDKDGDLDVLLTGDPGNPTKVAKIYRNDQGNFIDLNVALTPVWRGSVDWADYNNDGNFDILLTGERGDFRLGDPAARIYSLVSGTSCPAVGPDGNNDSIPDAQQDNVETLSSATGNIVTFAASDGIMLRNVKSSQPSEEPPENVELPQGLLEFTAEGLTAGGSFTMTLNLPADSTANTYWKYGPTPDNPTAEWYDFSYDETTKTGAKINGSTVTLHFVDGARGDSDLQANGSITDPGGPAITAQDDTVDLYLPLLFQ